MKERAAEFASATTSSTPMIDARKVSKQFKRKGNVITAVADLDLQVAQGEFVCLVGPSGCGKSTLLNMTAGLMEPSRGRVLYEGKPVPSPNTQVGYITQRDNLLPWRTTQKNIELPLEIRDVPRAQRSERASELIDLIGLDGFADAYPSELSGGMRKRVALARTLAYEPRCILADEPFGALDAQLKLVMADEFLRIWSRTNSTVLFVTHDLMEAIVLADRVVLLSSRPGHVKIDCKVEMPRPRDVYSARFSETVASLYETLWRELVDEMHEGEEM